MNTNPDNSLENHTGNGSGSPAVATESPAGAPETPAGDPGTNGSQADNNERRKNIIKAERFVNTPQSEALLGAMENLYSYPTRHRMPCMSIVGSANSGKSSLLRKFITKHPRFRDKAEYADKLPIVYFMLTGATERDFYDDAFRAMQVNSATSHNLCQKKHHFIQTCVEMGVKMLVLDEFHNAAHGTGRQQSKYCTFIKTLSNELCVPFIIAGTYDVRPFINSEEQLNSRFIYRKTINPWQYDVNFRGFLKALENKYFLQKPSNLGSTEELGQKILKLTDGLTGEIIHLMEFAAIEAIDSGQEQITEPLFGLTRRFGGLDGSE